MDLFWIIFLAVAALVVVGSVIALLGAARVSAEAEQRAYVMNILHNIELHADGEI